MDVGVVADCLGRCSYRSDVGHRREVEREKEKAKFQGKKPVSLEIPLKIQAETKKQPRETTLGFRGCSDIQKARANLDSEASHLTCILLSIHDREPFRLPFIPDALPDQDPSTVDSPALRMRMLCSTAPL